MIAAMDILDLGSAHHLILPHNDYISAAPQPFSGGRAMVMQAQALTDEFASDAAHAARLRAAQSRSLGNIVGYCRWREVERLLSIDAHCADGAARH